MAPGPGKARSETKTEKSLKAWGTPYPWEEKRDALKKKAVDTLRRGKGWAFTVRYRGLASKTAKS